MRVEVCLTVKEYQQKYYDSIAVVIDVLRATTCIATGFANHCRQIYPVKTVEEAVALKTGEYSLALLAGERQGLVIPGFDLGNSPFDYSLENVENKSIIMTTTNGTMALNVAASSREIYTAAFVNAKAVVESIKTKGCDVVLVCSGTDGRFSLEDALCAGYLVELLASTELSDTAIATKAMYQNSSKDLLALLNESSHASYLKTIGYEQDIEFCLQKNIFDVAPRFKNQIITV